MDENQGFEVIIIGGSYAGLSAAMALGRSMRQVLIIDSGEPCNRQTPHSHNFITQDGQAPGQIAAIAKDQVLQYKTVQFIHTKAVNGKKIANGFEIVTESGVYYTAKKLLFATGITDLMPPIKGFAACWGISVLYCPYCHGYEVRDATIGIVNNGDTAFELCRLIYNWSKHLILFTNGAVTLTTEQVKRIREHNIEIIPTEIAGLHEHEGNVSSIQLKDGSKQFVAAIFSRLAFQQHCNIPEQLGAALTMDGYVKIDEFQRTTIEGVYAAGDNTTPLRALSAAIAAGTKAGTFINKEMVEEFF